MKGYCRILHDFSQETSAHGVPRIGRADTKKVTCFWLSICSICMVMFLTQTYSIFSRYFKYEKITQIEMRFQKAKFPAVTLCNLNPYKKSLAKDIPGLAGIIDAVEASQNKRERTARSVNMFEAAQEDESLIFNNRFVPVFAYCFCPLPDPGSECLPFGTLKPSDSKCVCMYDRTRKTAWPCYTQDRWTKKTCRRSDCQADGICSGGRKNKEKKKSSSKGKRATVLISDESNFTMPMNSTSPPSVFNETTEVPKTKPNTIPCICDDILKRCIVGPDGDFINLWEAKDQLQWPPVKKIPTTTPAFLAFEETAKDPGTMVSQAQDSMTFVAGSLEPETVANISYSQSEFILQCSFNQQDCDRENDIVSFVDTKYGNCYTFNPQRNASKTSSRAGPLYGLSVLLNVYGYDYLPMTTGKGARIAIHYPAEYPFPDTYGYNAPPGFLSQFGIRLQKFMRMSWPFEECIFEGKDEDYIYADYAYSAEGCYRTCWQRYMNSKCNCSDPTYPPLPNVSYCQAEDPFVRDCFKRIKTELADMDLSVNCKCKQPCRQTVYKITFSTAKWPPSISNFNTLCESLGVSQNCEEYLVNNAVYVEIFYEQLNYESLNESAAYLLPNLVADFGGQLGLWMGMSIITCTEIMVLLGVLCRTCCSKEKFDENANELTSEAASKNLSDLDINAPAMKNILNARSRSFGMKYVDEDDNQDLKEKEHSESPLIRISS